MAFAYTQNITVVSRVNHQVVYYLPIQPVFLREISFDLLMGRILLTTREAPVLYSTLENEKTDTWRQFLAKGKIEDALKYARTHEQKMYLAGLWAD